MRSVGNHPKVVLHHCHLPMTERNKKQKNQEEMLSSLDHLCDITCTLLLPNFLFLFSVTFKLNGETVKGPHLLYHVCWHSHKLLLLFQSFSFSLIRKKKRRNKKRGCRVFMIADFKWVAHVKYLQLSWQLLFLFHVTFWTASKRSPLLCHVCWSLKGW